MGDIVKYSKDTVEANPGMIYNEYYRLITEQKNKIKQIEDEIDGATTFIYKIDNTDIRHIPYQQFKGMWHRECHVATVVMDNKKLMMKLKGKEAEKILANSKILEKKLAKAKEYLSEIEDEKRYFCAIYGIEEMTDGTPIR